MRPPLKLLTPMAGGDDGGEFVDAFIERADETDVFADLLHAVHEFGAAQERDKRAFDFAAWSGGDIGGGFFLCGRHLIFADHGHALGCDCVGHFAAVGRHCVYSS